MKNLPKQKLSRLMRVMLIVCLIISGTMFTTKQSFASGTPSPAASSACKASFVFYTTNGFTDLSESFTDISFSFNPIVSWNWSFGDGTTSNQQNPVHLYSSAGFYNVCLATVDSTGCTDTTCKSVHVIVIAVPTYTVTPTSPSGKCKAAFTFNTTNNFTDLSESFTDISFSFNPIVSWNWSFGDGTTSNVQNPAHLYTSAGTYNVCLATLDSTGCADTSCTNVHVTTIPTFTITPTPPLSGNCKAAFVFTTTNGFTDLSESFTDISFTFNTITSWTWSFGDGTTSNVQNPVHLYSSAGTYNVCLATQDNTGCTDTSCTSVYVTAFVTNTVTPTPMNNCAAAFDTHANGLTASFIDLSFTMDTIISWSWDFGDGNTSTLQNPSNTYANSGNYTVCLTIQSVSGCVGVLCYGIYVDTGLVYMKKQPVSHNPNVAHNTSITDRTAEVTLKVYPNPAAESTAISYSLPADGFAKVSVYDMMGNEIEVLAASADSKGEHSITWNTNNVTNGIYLVRIMTNDNIITKQLIVTK